MSGEDLRRRIQDLEAEVESCRARISFLEAERAGHVVKRRRTQLVNMAGESCDYIKALESVITVGELRAKVAESKRLKPRRIQIFGPGKGVGAESHLPLADNEEIHHEVIAVSQPSGSLGSQTPDFCSAGEPYRLLVTGETRVYSGRAKCSLRHNDEFNKFQKESWMDEWVDITMEDKDLGLHRHDQLRIFVGDVDLVRYGELSNPHIRQLETFGNKSAGELTLRVCDQLSGPRPKDSPGFYDVTAVRGLPVMSDFIRPGLARAARIGQLYYGDKVKVLEVVEAPLGLPPGWAFVHGRIDWQGAPGWIKLLQTMTGDTFVVRPDAEKLYKVELKRLYCVERGDGKTSSEDISEIWFATDVDRGAFVAAYQCWERNNPMPSRTEGHTLSRRGFR